MQASLYVGILAAVSAVMAPFATGQSKPPHQGTIVDVQKQGVTTPVKTAWINDDEKICNEIGGSNCAPVSTPSRSNYYRYNVSVKLDCEVFVGHYVSASDNLPVALSGNNQVPVRLEKHVMYIDFPGDTVEMRIIHREASREGACRQMATAK